MLGGGRQVRVVIENMMGRMENLRTLISGFLGLVILVRWALVTMFLSWTTQTGCRIHRTYVSLIGSGEGRHTTHLLKYVPLLSTSQTDWKQSSDVLSDISFDILSDISSDISSDILSDISSDILSDIFLTYLLTFFLTNLLTLFLTYLLTYLSTCFLTYLLTFFLTYQNQNLTSTASHKKPLCKLYIYLTPRSKSNIHDNFVPVNVIALSASDRPAKRQLSPKMQNACNSTHTHTTCIRPPRQKAVESKNAKEFEVPQLHLMACANHEVRCSPLRFFRRICIGGPAPHVICLPLMHSILPKRGRSTKDCSALLQLLLALRIWNRPPFICHIPLVSLHDFFHDKHQIPSMCSARRLHAHVHALSTNKSQLCSATHAQLLWPPDWQSQWRSSQDVPPQPPPWLPNQTHFLAQKQTWANNTCCNVQNKTKNQMPSTRFRWCKHKFLLSRSMYAHILGTYFLTFFLTYLLTFFLTYLLPFFLTYLLTFFLTYLLTFFLTILSDISFDSLSDIPSDILSDIFLTYLLTVISDISSDISFWPIFLTRFLTYLWHSSDNIWLHSDISSDILSDISFDILFWHIFWHSVCYISWHISRFFFWTYLLTFFLAHLLTFFLTYLLTFFLTFFLTYLSPFFLTYLLTFFLTYLLAFFLTCLHFTFFLTYLLTFFLTYLSDILSDISSGILFDIYFWHISWHYSWHIFWHSFWHIFWH